MARMLRDVLVTSINRGQFPPALLALVALAIVFKMPAADMSLLALRVVSLMERHELLGYAFTVFCAAGWFLHARLQRRWIGDERRRMSSERAELRALLTEIKARLSGVRS